MPDELKRNETNRSKMESPKRKETTNKIQKHKLE